MKNLPLTSAFWHLWLKYRKSLLEQGLRRMGGSLSDAEDALNVTMLRALASYPNQARSLHNPKAWLRRILRNVCTDIHRERKRRPESSECPELELQLQEVPSTGMDPEVLLLEREREQRIRAQVHQLPPNLRQPFLMRFYQDRSYPDIAAELRLTDVNVRKRIQLAYSLLRVALSDEAPGS